MFQIKKFKNLLILTLMIVGLTSASCSSDDDNSTPTVEVSVNGTVLFDDGDDFNGDVDGDFNGDGGSDSRLFMWENSLTTADFNADITATTEGSFRIVVLDADDNIVLDRSLSGASEPDSIDGVTETGTSGMWKVTITLTSFNGDGSFSLSEGN